jgi:crotonobetainyl-CoA:carnitine CoA-transferase CaiB-like acyl-CoA transferase
VGSFASPAAPARFAGVDDGPKGPAPALGQHTREVLEGLGYDGGQIDGLYASKAVA